MSKSARQNFINRQVCIPAFCTSLKQEIIDCYILCKHEFARAQSHLRTCACARPRSVSCTGLPSSCEESHPLHGLRVRGVFVAHTGTCTSCKIKTSEVMVNLCSRFGHCSTVKSRARTWCICAWSYWSYWSYCCPVLSPE